jgi:hypothetical protein
MGRRLTFFSTSITPSSTGTEAGCGISRRVRIASGNEETIMN